MAFKIKKCVVCGESFIPSNGRQLCCNDKCKILYKQKYDDNYYCNDKDLINPNRKYYIYVDYINNENMYINEIKRSSEPSEKDIAIIEDILKDFGLNIKAPKFHTYKELNQWKNKMIKSVLS